MTMETMTIRHQYPPPGYHRTEDRARERLLPVLLPIRELFDRPGGCAELIGIALWLVALALIWGYFVLWLALQAVPQ